MRDASAVSTGRLLLDPTLGRPFRLGILGFWTAMGLVESSKAYVSAQLREAPVSWAQVLIGNMPWWYGWALLTPAIFWLASQWRLDRRGWKPALAVQFASALLISFAHLAAVGVLFYYTNTRGSGFVQSPPHQIRIFVDGYLAVNVLTYFAVVGGYYAIDLARRFREREVTTARLEARMHEARLAALRAELNPHFLFNALNAVAALVRRREHDAAVGALARLGELLRGTLDRQATHESSLEDELAFLRQYLEIERLRFHDRLVVREEIDPAVLDALVPTLILQPLVENAVRHGIARTPGPGRITLRAERIAAHLYLIVRDTGGGFSQDGQRDEGVGLSNTRARLAQLYSGQGTMETRTPPEGGAEVIVTVPYHTDRVLVTADASA
jgi:two-component system, LytTR family, sensor kinase